LKRREQSADLGAHTPRLVSAYGLIGAVNLNHQN